MRNYCATIKVTRFYEYELAFESTNFKQAFVEAEKFIKDKTLNNDFERAEIKLVGVKHDAS